MPTIRAYHRPETLDDALQLLTRPGAMALGGGTLLNGRPAQSPVEVVDLQSLALDSIARNNDLLAIGAMVRLQDVATNEWVPPLLRDLAHREGPNTVRNAATVGGTVATADFESVLLAGLLAHGATVAVARSEGDTTATLADVLADRSMLSGGLITAVQVSIGEVGVSAGTGRTPVDTPIVMVAGININTGSGFRLAATGVAPTPVLIDLEAIDQLAPPADFRGSASYRRHLATTLGTRVTAELASQGQS